MPAARIDGEQLAAAMRDEIALRVADRVRAGRPPPGLAAVLVGDDPASQVYVRNKRRDCEKVGFRSWLHPLPADAPQTQLLELVARLNADPAVHGILVQLPLPRQMDEETIIRSIDPRKDVDGFHPENVGLLAAGHPRFLPCTPFGVQQLLARNNIATAGKHVVVIGRSNIVGKPLALILMQKPTATHPEFGDATVTVCHSRTRDLASITRQADILVAAIGRARFVTADMVKPGAAVVDVGINRVDGKLTGDVDAGPVAAVAGALTPVPGGVGPMTRTMLLRNTLNAAEMS